MTTNIPDGPLNINHWQEEAEDFRKKRDWWWKTLYDLRMESKRRGASNFDDWLEETHGVAIVYDSHGHITGNYDIVDEGKYLVFILKYG